MARVRFDLKRLNSICSMVSLATNRIIPRAKPIIGEDIFTHTSSIHLDGIQKDFANYQTFPPDSVGRQHSTSFGKYSGLKTIMRLLKAKGIDFDQEAIDKLSITILHQTQRLKKSLNEEDIMRIVSNGC